MPLRKLIIVVAILVVTVVALAILFIFQAPQGWKLFKPAEPPPDRRVAWVEPPGRFEPAGGSIQSAPVDSAQGGLVDYAGRTVHFRGIEFPFSPDWTASEPAIDFAALRKSGINLISLPVRWQDLEPAPMEVSVDTIIAIRNFLDRAGGAGIAVVLINTAPFSGDSECPWMADAPMWAFRVPPSDSSPAGVDCGSPDDDDAAAVSRFRADFLGAAWTPDNLTLQDHLIRSWIKLAEVVSRSAGLAGFGLADSMACPAGMDAAACSSAWTGYMDRFANGMRAVDGPALFFVGTEGPAPAAGNDGLRLTELVPGAADESARGPLKALPSGTFIFNHIHLDSQAGFLEAVDGVERRGRSWLVGYPGCTAAKCPAAAGRLPNADAMARPRPDAVSGSKVRFSFDRLSLPTGPDDPATEPGTTDTFTLEFDDLELKDGMAAETTVWLPVDRLYGGDTGRDAPPFTIHVSDGTVEWLPGRDDMLMWRTVDGFGLHTMKIIPWGGRRLQFRNRNQ